MNKLSFAILIVGVLVISCGCRSWTFERRRKYYLKSNLFYNVKQLSKRHGIRPGMYPVVECPQIIGEGSEFVPINTRCLIRPMRRRGFTITLDDGARIVILYHGRHVPGERLGEYARRFVGEQPVSLSDFSGDDAKNVKSGHVVIGMRDTAMNAAWGPPLKSAIVPGGETRAFYWYSLRKKFYVSLVNGRVVGISK